MNSPYEILAKYYDTITWPAQDKRNKAILAIAEKHGLHSLCDFGCGTGLLIKLFLEHNLEASGCDLSEEMIEVAKTNIAGRNDRTVAVQDMIKYIPPPLVDLATCNYDTVNYLLSQDLWKTFFANVYDSLSNNGLFLFDFVTLYDLRECWPGYKQYYEGDSWALLRTAEYNASNDIGLEWFHWYVYHDGVWSRDTEKHLHTSMGKDIVRDLLFSVGFANISMRDADTGGEVYDNETTRIEIIAFKENK